MRIGINFCTACRGGTLWNIVDSAAAVAMVWREARAAARAANGSRNTAINHVKCCSNMAAAYNKHPLQINASYTYSVDKQFLYSSDFISWRLILTLGSYILWFTCPVTTLCYVMLYFVLLRMLTRVLLLWRFFFLFFFLKIISLFWRCFLVLCRCCGLPALRNVSYF